MFEFLITMTAVVLAAVFLLRRAWRSLNASEGSACGSCSTRKSGATQPKPQPFVPLDALTVSTVDESAERGDG